MIVKNLCPGMSKTIHLLIILSSLLNSINSRINFNSFHSSKIEFATVSTTYVSTVGNTVAVTRLHVFASGDPAIIIAYIPVRQQC